MGGSGWTLVGQLLAGDEGFRSWPVRFTTTWAPLLPRAVVHQSPTPPDDHRDNPMAGQIPSPEAVLTPVPSPPNDSRAALHLIVCY